MKAIEKIRYLSFLYDVMDEKGVVDMNKVIKFIFNNKKGPDEYP